jgi:hypothetical protein
MKRGVSIILVIIILAFAAGCALMPSEAPSGEEGSAELADEAIPAPEPASAGDLIDQVAQEEVQEVPSYVEEGVVEEANLSTDLPVSGSLELQNDLERCPHLAASFECDRYDIRRCEFNRFVGRNGFYPNLIDCRDGRADKGQDPDKKYCLIQGCRPLTSDNIVYAYGGPTAYAEYIYHVENVEGGIMTHYSLNRCGEQYDEFDTSFDCTVYKSRLDMFK